MSSSRTRRGSRPLSRGLELAPVLPELGLDIGHAEQLVDLLFRPPGDHLLAPEDAVLVDLELPLDAHEPDGDVVGLGAGEIVERGPERDERHDPQVDLKPAAEEDGGLRLALGQDLGDVVVVDEAVHDVPALLGGDQDVDVPDRFGAAPVAPGDLDLLDALGSLQILEERRHDLLGHGQLEPLGAVPGDLGPAELLEDGLLRLLAEAGELADLPLGGGLSSGPRARRP